MLTMTMRTNTIEKKCKKEGKKINKNLQLKKVGQRIPIIIFSPPYQNAAQHVLIFSFF